MSSPECVKVVVRARPLNQQEVNMGSQCVVEVDPQRSQCAISNSGDPSAVPKQFTFDSVYDMNTTAESIYMDIIYPLVESVLEGYNGTVFAYGQTGSGKSFTMQGPDNWPAQKGIIPRTFEHIFEAIATTANVKFLVYASYLEIYIEDVRDLLAKDKKHKLEIKEHPERGVYVAGLSMHSVHDVMECEKLLQKGMRSRATAATLMNTDSSRSHSIFTVHLEMIESRDDGEHIKTAKLHLVDLAGSERQSKTGTVGERLKEATKINLSLSALGNVISALVDGKSTHIPYRDSKLTRLLQDSLGGNTKTVMIACLSPADYNYEESLSTLRYANRAKRITNKPRINEDPKDALLRQYQEEIQRLKQLLESAQRDQAVQPPLDSLVQESDAIKQLRENYERQMSDLQENFRREQITKSRLEREFSRLQADYNSALEDLASKGKGTGAGGDSERRRAMERIQMLQEQMIGGELVDNAVVVEKRKRKKREAERRREKLREIRRNQEICEQQMLNAYRDVNETLESVNRKLEAERRRNKSLERDVQDLQSEFERDRQDYLNTIRKQIQQNKLLLQLLHKVKPCIPRDCNYADLEAVRKAAVWDGDSQSWTLPDVVISKVRLPRTESATSLRSASAKEESNQGTSGSDSGEECLRQTLARGEEENIAGTYFKPVSRRPITRIQVPGKQPLNHQTWRRLQSGYLYTDDLYNQR